MTHPRPPLRAALLLLLALGCNDATSGPVDAGAARSFCERYSALSDQIGCGPSVDCSKVASACEPLANAWLDCVYRDVTQCLCESDGDGDINCEGSYKPSEGPALCVDEIVAFDSCSRQ